MKLARQEGVIDFVPATPRVKRQDNSRSFFRFYPLVEKDHDEYKLLLKTATEMADEHVRVRDTTTTNKLYGRVEREQYALPRFRGEGQKCTSLLASD
jgi:hypothetical protein